MSFWNRRMSDDWVKARMAARGFTLVSSGYDGWMFQDAERPENRPRFVRVVMATDPNNSADHIYDVVVFENGAGRAYPAVTRKGLSQLLNRIL